MELGRIQCTSSADLIKRVRGFLIMIDAANKRLEEQERSNTDTVQLDSGLEIDGSASDTDDGDASASEYSSTIFSDSYGKGADKRVGKKRGSSEICGSDERGDVSGDRDGRTINLCVALGNFDGTALATLEEKNELGHRQSGLLGGESDGNYSVHNNNWDDLLFVGNIKEQRNGSEETCSHYVEGYKHIGKNVKKAMSENKIETVTSKEKKDLVEEIS